MRIEASLLAAISVWFLVANVARSDLITGLEGYWNLDGSLNDQSVNGRNASCQGGGSETYGATPLRSGSSISLDGSHHLRIDGWTGILGRTARTCVAWIKTSSDTVGTGTGGVGGALGDGIMAWGATSDGRRWELWIDEGSDEYQQLRLVAHGGTDQGGPDIADQAWHHVVVGMASNSTVADLVFYVDGQEVAAADTSTRVINTAASGDVRVGAGRAGDMMLDGLVDDPAIWSRLLTSAEVAALHGLGRIEGLALDHAFLDTFLTQFAAQGTARAPSGNHWMYATGLSGGLGTISGGGEIGSYIVLDDSGNGMTVVPAPTIFIVQ